MINDQLINNLLLKNLLIQKVFMNQPYAFVFIYILFKLNNKLPDNWLLIISYYS